MIRTINQKFKIIPYIVSGQENTELSHTDMLAARNAIEQMKDESRADRLGQNYSTWLKLEKMAMYCIVLDNKSFPVMTSGAQHMSQNVCRLFSRYYLFDSYRTKHINGLYEKVDNFQTDLYMLQELKPCYKLFIWSRDKGIGFFKKIRKARPDIFKSWTVHNQNVEILWKNNIQGIMYVGDISYINELIFRE